MEAKLDKFMCVDMVTVLKKKKREREGIGLPSLHRQLQLSLLANTDLTAYYFS